MGETLTLKNKNLAFQVVSHLPDVLNCKSSDNHIHIAVPETAVRVRQPPHPAEEVDREGGRICSRI